MAKAKAPAIEADDLPATAPPVPQPIDAAAADALRAELVRHLARGYELERQAAMLRAEADAAGRCTQEIRDRLRALVLEGIDP